MSDTLRTTVIGIGNPLMGDDGVGIRIVEKLMAGYEFPEGVEVMDSGTMGFMLLDTMRSTDRLLVLDAIDGTGYEPGAVFVLTPDEAAPSTLLHSLHDTRLVDVLDATALMGYEVEALVVGVQIKEVREWVLELHPEVEAAIPIALAAAIDTLKQWGIELTPREGSHVDATIIEALRTYEPMGVADEVLAAGAAQAANTAATAGAAPDDATPADTNATGDGPAES